MPPNIFGLLEELPAAVAVALDEARLDELAWADLDRERALGAKSENLVEGGIFRSCEEINKSLNQLDWV